LYQAVRRGGAIRSGRKRGRGKVPQGTRQDFGQGHARVRSPCPHAPERKVRAMEALMTSRKRVWAAVLFLAAVAMIGFAAGWLAIQSAQAADEKAPKSKKQPRIVYPKKTDLDFE